MKDKKYFSEKIMAVMCGHTFTITRYASVTGVRDIYILVVQQIPMASPGVCKAFGDRRVEF